MRKEDSLTALAVAGYLMDGERERSLKKKVIFLKKSC